MRISIVKWCLVTRALHLNQLFQCRFAKKKKKKKKRGRFMIFLPYEEIHCSTFLEKKKNSNIQFNIIKLHFLWCCNVHFMEIPYLYLSNKSQLIRLMHLQCVLNAKQNVFFKNWRKKVLQRHKQTKKLIWVEHPFKERKDKRCVTEQYAQHKVQAVRLCRLIKSRVGEEQWQKK